MPLSRTWPLLGKRQLLQLNQRLCIQALIQLLNHANAPFTASTSVPVSLCLGYSHTEHFTLLHTRALLMCQQILSKSVQKAPSHNYFPTMDNPVWSSLAEGVTAAATASPLMQHEAHRDKSIHRTIRFLRAQLNSWHRHRVTVERPWGTQHLHQMPKEATQ